MPHIINSFNFCPTCGSSHFTPTSSRSKKCSECGLEYFINIGTCVACFIMDNNNRIMFVKRACEPFKNFLDTPGGFVEDGESAEEATCREIKEETNIDMEPTKLQYLFSLPEQYHYANNDIPVISLYFAYRLTDFTNIKAGDDATEIVWQSMEEIDTSTVAFPSNTIAINRLKNSRK